MRLLVAPRMALMTSSMAVFWAAVTGMAVERGRGPSNEERGTRRGSATRANKP